MACGLQFGAAPSAAAADAGIWFDDLGALPRLSTEDQQALGQFVWQVLTRGGDDAAFPTAWQADVAPRIAFVSISDGLSRARVGRGSGRGLAAAVRQAVNAARRDLPADQRVRWVRFDLVAEVLTQSAAADPMPADWRRKRAGLASDRRLALALLPEELVANGLLTARGRVRPSGVAAYATRYPHRTRAAQDLRPWDAGAAYRFTTVGSFHDDAGAVPLVRGRRRFEQPLRRHFDAAARLAERYLTGAVKDDGRFVYSYQPDINSAPRAYNILRHAGTVYSLLEVYQRTRAESTLQAARRALDYLRSTVQPTTIRGRSVHCVVERGYVKLGGNALAVIALSKYSAVTGDRTQLPLARRLADFIGTVQGPDGRFLVHKARQFDGRPTGFVSGYYPGEAILALMRLYALERDRRYLDAAAKAADYLIHVRDGNATVDNLIHDHWLLYGLNELHRQRPDPAYLAHARRIVAAMHRAQHQANPDDDWYGGYYVPPTATATSTRIEGLAAACQLLRDFGTKDETIQARHAARLGAVFVLKRQLRPEAAMYFPLPQRCLGGVTMSLADPEIRIDYVQHALCCWLAVAQDLPDEQP